MERADVVVVGAGAAGLACAQALAVAGRDAVVLEARARVGGRLRTFRLGEETVELGAQVVHPTPHDPLRSALASAGLRTQAHDPDAEVFVVSGGRREDAATVAARWPPPPWVVEDRLASLHGVDATVTQALEVLPADCRPAAAAWLEQVLGGDPDLLHVGALAASRRARPTGEVVAVVGGFDRLAEALAEGLDVRTGSPVTAVRWGHDAVEVSGAQVLQADAAVVTVPPSVVLAGTVAFTPGLPAAWTEAAARLASHDALVVVLEGTRPAPTSAWVLLVDPPGGLWRTVAGSRVLTGHLKGRAAARGRTLDWSGPAATALAAQVAPDLGSATTVEVCDWGRDPWACGAYSLPVAGAADAAARWAMPLAGRVFFAGEASAQEGLRGLVQGALASGRRAAAAVLQASSDP